MGKISDYFLGKISNDLENFRVEVTSLLNYGKMAKPIVTTGPPSWKAQPGETVLFMPVSGGTTQYFYKNSAWVSSWSTTV